MVSTALRCTLHGDLTREVKKPCHSTLIYTKMFMMSGRK